MGKIQSLPFSHFESTHAQWANKDCVESPKSNAQILNNVLTFWAMGPGCYIQDGQTGTNQFQLQQCFKSESPLYRRVRICDNKNKTNIALLQHEHVAKRAGIIKPYGIYTYQPNYPGQEPHESKDIDAPIYLFAQLEPKQCQGFKWQYSVLQKDTSFKTMCYIHVQPRGFKYHCTFYQTSDNDESTTGTTKNHKSNNNVVIAQSLQKGSSNCYIDWGEACPIALAAGVDEIALLLMATAMEDHRDKMNNAIRSRGTKNPAWGFSSQCKFSPRVAKSPRMQNQC